MELIKSLIESIEEDNDDKFESTVIRLSEIKEELSKQEEERKALERKYADETLKNAKLQSQLSEMETTKISDKNLSDEVASLKQELIGLNSELSYTKEELNREKEKPDYTGEIERLRLENENLQEKLKASVPQKEDSELIESFKEQIEKMRADSKKLLAEVESKSEIISSLSNELEIFKKKPTFDQTAKKALEDKIKELQTQLTVATKGVVTVPVITESTKLSGEKVIVFRELKPCIYMNSLIEFVSTSYALYNNYEGKKKGKKLLIVLDPLTDDNRMIKYIAHNFKFNEMGNLLPVIITNKTEKEISELVNLSEYRFVTVIDRYGKSQCAVSRSDTDIYYAVDSYADIIDFNLNGSKCVGFMPDNKCKESRPFGYYITPFTTLDERYSGDFTPLMGESEFIQEVLCYEE